MFWGSSMAQNSQPNVLFIAIDDLRDYVGYAKTFSKVRTPNIDRLSKMGVSFTNAYCQAPMCAASRNSLLTGIYPFNSGAYGFQKRKEMPALDVITLPEHFKNNGYYVVGTGKIHHGSDYDGHGCSPEEWDEYWPSVSSPRDGSHGKPIESEFKQPWGHFKFGPTDSGDEAEGDHRHGEWAVNRLKKGFNQPFFMAVGFFRPHLPWFVPEKYFEQFPVDGLSPVIKKENDLNDVPAAAEFFGHFMHVGRYAYDVEITQKEWHQEALQAYLASVAFTDKQVGKVLDALENSPYANNTIIVLWTDHGFHLGEKQTWSKFTLWRESARVPLIISAPGMSKNSICKQPVQLIDLYPTLNTLCSLPLAGHEEGNNIKPLLRNPKANWKHPAITVAGKNNYAISTDKWRYISYFNGDEELYQIEEDPHEWNNLAPNPKYGKVVQKLRKYIPTGGVDNYPGSTLPVYYDRNTWDIEQITKRSIQQYQQRKQK